MKKQRALKSFFLLLIAVIIMLSICIIPSFAEEAGNSSEDFVEIRTAEEFDAIRNNLSGNYILMDDIDLEGFNSEQGGWIPIGGSAEEPFSGKLYGNGYSVTGYQITRAISGDYIALFGYVSGSISNLECSGAIDVLSVSATKYIGGICAYLTGSIEDCKSDVEICTEENVSSSTYVNCIVYVGGIAGYSSGAVNSCESKGAITASPNLIDYSEAYGYIGGVVGYNDNGIVSSSQNSGKIEVCNKEEDDGKERVSEYFFGGISGYSTGTITSCKNYGEVVAKNPKGYTFRYGAGVCGYSIGEINGCSNVASIDNTALYSYTGGIAGTNKGSIANCNNHGCVLGTSRSNGSLDLKQTYVAGIAGVSSGNIEKCYNVGDIKWEQMGGSEDVHVAGIAASSSGKISNCYNLGTVEGHMYYGCSGGIAATGNIIENCYNAACTETVSAIADSSSQLVVNCFYLNYAMRGVVGKDVSVSCTLQEMKLQSTYAGFDFENVWTIRSDGEFFFPDLISNPYESSDAVQNTDFSGGRGTVFDPYVIKTVEQLNNIRNYPYSHFILGNDIVFSGTNWETVPEFFGSINGNGYKLVNFKNHNNTRGRAGGASISFIGSMRGYICNMGMENASIQATISKIDGSNINGVGGFAGFMSGKMENCYFYGTIICSIDTSAGGIAASVSGSIINCYNVGSITCSVYGTGSDAGGIAGYLSGGSGDAGTWYGKIEGCYNLGTVSCIRAGGIVGYSSAGEIYNCYNAGKITSNNVAGGIAGIIRDNAKIKFSYNCGLVTASTVGAITGNSYGGVCQDCYYLDNMSVASANENCQATRLTREQMRDASNFEGFDFDSIWTMEGDGLYLYPELISTPASHSIGKTTEQNRNPTCVRTGLKVVIVYCATCNIELSRTQETIDALGHTEVVDEAVAPTCAQTGLTEGSHCSVCNATIVAQESVSALGHSFTNYTLDNNASCTKDGTETAKCDNCQQKDTKVVAGSAFGHTESEPVVENKVKPGCTTNGSYDSVVYCAVCNAEVSRTPQTVDALGHTESKAVVENQTDPTCVKEGTYYDVIYCSVCGAEISRTPQTLDALGHTKSEAVVENKVNPSCTKKGSCDSVVYCAVCDAEISRTPQTLDALGHTRSETIIENRVKPSCTKKGSYDSVVYCAVCDAEISRTPQTLDALGHTESEAVVENRVKPSCTKAGSYDEVIYCSICGVEVSRVTQKVSALGHTESDAIVENRVKPSCTKKGSYDSVVYCAVCDAEISRTTQAVDALGHTAIIDKAVAPTCTQTGLTEGSHCSVCNATIVAQESVSALGHSFTNYTLDNNASCTKDGTETAKCDNCQQKDTKVVAGSAFGHTPSSAVYENIVEQDCENDGSRDKVIYCLTCGAELSRNSEILDALGHTAIIDKAVAPTCTQTGLTEGSHCSVCSEVIIAQNVIDANGHSYQDWKIEENSTCISKGIEKRQCSNCEEVESREFDEAKDHIDLDHDNKCDMCGEKLSNENKAAKVAAIAGGSVAGAGGMFSLLWFVFKKRA